LIYKYLRQILLI